MGSTLDLGLHRMVAGAVGRLPSPHAGDGPVNESTTRVADGGWTAE